MSLRRLYKEPLITKDGSNLPTNFSVDDQNGKFQGEFTMCQFGLTHGVQVGELEIRLGFVSMLIEKMSNYASLVE